MFGLSDLKQTRVYQEAFAEGRQEGKQEGKQEGTQEGVRQQKLKTVPLLLRLDLSMEEVAQELELTVEEVRQAAQQKPSDA